jgi:hypothetical protein
MIVLAARLPRCLRGDGEGFDSGEGGGETRRDTRVDAAGFLKTGEAGRPHGPDFRPV